MRLFLKYSLLKALLLAFVFQGFSASVFAAEYNDGEACSTSGAFHVKNSTEGVFHLVCNGTTWENVVFIDKDENIAVPSYCDATGTYCFDATYVQSGLIRPVASAVSPVFENDLNNLDDVVTTGAADGECIVYNSTSGDWEANTCNGNTTTSIEVVATATSPLFSNDIDNLDDVNASAATDGECLVYSSSSGDWETGACGSGSTTAIELIASAASPVFENDLTSLNDVDTSGVSGGQCLIYNSISGLWEPGTCATGTTTTIEIVASASSPLYDNQIGGLNDVNTSGVSANDLLIWDGSNWTPNTLSLNDLNNADTSGVSLNDVLIWDGSNWSPNTMILNDLNNVDTSGVNVNDILIWNGSNWVANTGIPSDERLKKDIQNLQPETISKLLTIEPVSYQMINGNGNLEFGVIAQDVEEVFPHLVTTNKEQMKSVNYIGLIAPMMLTIQDLSEQNKKLEERIKILEQKIEEDN